MGGNKILGGLRKTVDPLGLTGGENIFGGHLYKGKPFGKNVGTGITKMFDPLGLLGGENIFGGRTYGRTNSQGTYAPMTKGLSSNPQYFAQQQQMLNNMRQQQQAKLANLQTQGQTYPNAVAPIQSVETAQAPTTTTPVALAQSKVDDTTAPADMPTEYIYKPATARTSTVAANTFQMPDMSSIKFGGA